jgi:hypothetical protein
MEKHHVTPKCLGGDNSQENIVLLTPEEHYVAHQLLVKIYPGNHSLMWSASCMTGKTGRQSGRQNKLYGWLRRRFGQMISERQKGKKLSDEHKAKLSAAKLGKKRPPHSENTKSKMSAASKGREKSESHRLALAAAKLGKKTGPHDNEWNEKIRQSHLASAQNRDYSYLQDPVYKQNQSRRMIEIWKQRKSGEALNSDTPNSPKGV